MLDIVADIKHGQKTIQLWIVCSCIFAFQSKRKEHSKFQ